MNKNAKLTINDIFLKSPGQQIKSLILQNYSSMNEFSQKNDLSPSSVHQYLCSKHLGSNTFKIKLVKALNMDFEAMYKTEETQIKEFVDLLSENINSYNQKEDVAILEKLKNICFNRKMLDEYATVCRDYSIYYYNLNELNRAISYMELCINHFKNRKNTDVIMKYISELGEIYVDTGLYSKGRKIILDLEKMLSQNENIQDNIKFSIYFNMGNIYAKLKEPWVSEQMYLKALGCASTPNNIFISLRALGHHYKNEKSYSKALTHYNKALDICSKNNFNETYLYNDYAELYLEMEDYDKANIYTDKVFNNIKNNISSSKNNFLYVYSKIKLNLNMEDSILQKITNLFEEVPLGYIYTNYHVDVIDQIIDLSKQKKYFLKNLMETLIQIYNSKQFNDPLISSKLKNFIGNITLILYNM